MTILYIIAPYDQKGLLFDGHFGLTRKEINYVYPGIYATEK